MKKLIVIPVLLFMLILSACNTSHLAFSEIEVVPDDVQGVMNPDLTLQLLQDGKRAYYIMYHSNGDIEAELEEQGDTLTIKFDELDPSDTNKQQHVYHLVTDRNHDVIDVMVNGESTGFDEVINE